MVDLQNDPRFNIHAIAENKKNELDSFVAHLYCCHSTGCKSSGADDLLAEMSAIIEEHGLQEKIRLVPTGCMGLCAQGPLVRVEIKGRKDVLFKRLTAETIKEIINKLF